MLIFVKLCIWLTGIGGGITAVYALATASYGAIALAIFLGIAFIALLKALELEEGRAPIRPPEDPLW